jgi:hypothetical protein
MNSHDRFAYSGAGKYVDRSWEYINRSQTHECGNWDRGRATSLLGIYKWDFRCSVDISFDSSCVVPSTVCTNAEDKQLLFL